MSLLDILLLTDYGRSLTSYENMVAHYGQDVVDARFAAWNKVVEHTFDNTVAASCMQLHKKRNCKNKKK